MKLPKTLFGTRLRAFGAARASLGRWPCLFDLPLPMGQVDQVAKVTASSPTVQAITGPTS
eukprot:15469386-Alexandrium_andersonii.AAC.1